ncbi:MAG: SDR family oxidoreductase [Pseudomonadales bacterium]
MSDKKVCLITGASNGIGLATAIELARRNYAVYLHGRNSQKLAECVALVKAQCSHQDIHGLTANLAVLDEVRGLATQFLDQGRPLDCLISNAGVTNTARQLTVDGYEEMFAVNHLAPFLLTNLLLDHMKEQSKGRIVIVASGAHAFVKGINFDDPGFESGFASMKVYGHSKLANMLFTRELAKRLGSGGLTANCCHPGAVATGLGTNNGWLGKAIMGMMKPFFRTAERGAESSIYLADSSDVNGQSGGYFYNSKPKTPKPWALDDEAAARLWSLSENMVGL